MFDIPIYDYTNGKTILQNLSDLWGYVLINSPVPISKALDAQSHLTLRWSHIR